MLISWQRCMFDFAHTHIYRHTHIYTLMHDSSSRWFRIGSVVRHHQLAFVFILFFFYSLFFILNGTDWNMCEYVCVCSLVVTNAQWSQRPRTGCLKELFRHDAHTHAFTRRDYILLYGVFSRLHFSLFFSSFLFCYLLVVQASHQ